MPDLDPIAADVARSLSGYRGVLYRLLLEHGIADAAALDLTGSVADEIVAGTLTLLALVKAGQVSPPR